MNIIELLKMRGLDVDLKIKMMRHQSPKYNVQEMYKKREFEIYQSFQSKKRLDNCDYLVSFIGYKFTWARFVGVYKVGKRIDAKDATLPDGYPYPEFKKTEGNFYVLKKCEGYDDLEDRVIIDWGKSTRAWVRWLSRMTVIEVLPEPNVMIFPGFENIVLKMDELRSIMKSNLVHRDWHVSLKNTAGIYLIYDSETGKQYIGSAYGKDGILGRWREYAKNGHGNNKFLEELLKKEGSSHTQNFIFSILRIMPLYTEKDDVIAQECLYKKKLGTRAYGLNSN